MPAIQEPPTREHSVTVTQPPVRKRRGFNISAWAIEHPYVVIAFYAAIVILAIVAVFGGVMPRRMMPYVESPMVGIVTMQSGLSAQEMETYISKPIEERMTDIPGVRYIRSTSQDGLSMVSLEFPYGTNMQKATEDVQAIMKNTEGDLPQSGANLKPYWVLPIDPLNIPVLSLSVTGDPKLGWTPVALRQFAENQGVDALKQVPNVQSVDVYGGEKRQLRVVVDRDKLAAYGYSILDVRDAINKNSVAAPAGYLTSGPNETIVRVADLAQNPQTVANYPLGAKNGQVVYIKDVASVTDDVREQRSGYQYVDGVRHTLAGANNDAVELAVIQNPAAGSPPVIAAVQKQIALLEQDHPGLHFQVAYDNAHFVNILFRNTGEELALAVLLCGLAVLLFLGNGRATIISVITIPVSLAMAILLMVPFGFSLNSSTLIGLLISIGRLVDDSVIDIHAVERHLKMGKNPKAATVDGITEVRLAVAASTIMLVLALLPLVFCGGITQLMFVGLVYPIIFGLIASFLVSLTLTALLASKMLTEADARDQHGVFQRRIMGPIQAGMDRLDARYQSLVRVLLRHKATVIAAAVCTIIIGFGFYNFIGSEMMPLADVGQAYGVLEMEPSASFAQTQAAATALDKILLRHPEIQKVSTQIGTEPGGTYFTGYAMNQVNSATMMITLSDKDERRKTVWQVIDAVQKEALATIPNIRRLQIKEMGSDVMASSEAPVTILVTGPNLDILSKLAGQVAAVARNTPGAYQVATSWAMEKPSYVLNVDPQRAAEIGLTPTNVANQTYYAMGGALADEFYRLPNIRQDTIDIRYQGGQRRSIYDLMQMPITGSQGQQVPLKTLATYTAKLAPTLIEHDGLHRSISVLAYYRKGGPPSMDLAMSIITKASSTLNFPPGYSLQMRGDMTQMMDSFRRLLGGLEIAILLIFLVLVAQFGGLLAPLQMLLSIPLELAGVFIGLWVAHQAFSSVSIMAVIVLTGMNITTAILLIDQIMRRRREHPEMPRDEAIALSCRDRLRPILMTALITIVTMLPVALAPKTGMDAYQPLGTVIVSGLLAGTLLSLLVIPVMHALVDDLGRLRTRRKTVTVAAGLLVCFLGLPHIARADAPKALPALPVVNRALSLKDALALATINSITLKQASADARIAEATARAAQAPTRPSLSTTTYATTGDAANTFGTSPGVEPHNVIRVPMRGFADQNLMLMAPLFTGGKLKNAESAALQQSEAAGLSAQASQLTVTDVVTEAYADAALQQALVDVAQARLTAEDEQVRVTQEKVTTGRLAPVDLLREQAEQADARQSLLAAQNEAALALVSLKTAMGVSQESQMTLADTLDGLTSDSSLPATLPDGLRQAEANRPELGASLKMVASAQAALRAVKGEYAPQVYAVAMGDAMTGPDTIRAGYTVGLTASLPLLDGGQRRADVDAAQARLERATANAQQMRQTVDQDVAAAWLTLGTAQAQVQSAKLGVMAAQESYDLANLRYNAGKSITAERLDALSTLVRAQGTLAEAKAAVVIARTKLRRAIG